MPHLSHKQLLMAGGAVALIALFMWYRNRQAAASSPAPVLGTPQDQSGADYSSLAGQEASDVAGLASQESTDVSGLNNEIAGLTSTINGLVSTVAGLTPGTAGAAGDPGAPGAAGAPGAPGTIPASLTKEIAAVMAGQKRLSKQVEKLQHRKKSTPHPHRPATAAHSNGHHPAGTAGHAVAPRHHAPHVAKPKSAPAHHAPAHGQTTAQRRAERKHKRTK